MKPNELSEFIKIVLDNIESACINNNYKLCSSIDFEVRLDDYNTISFSILKKE